MTPNIITVPPSRRPNYNRLYPNDAAVETAVRARSVVGELLSSEDNDFTVRSLKDDVREFDFSALQGPSTKLNIPSGRALGEYVCNILQTRLVYSAHGRIDDILLTVPPFTDSRGRPYEDMPVSPSYDRHFRRLLRQMSVNERSYTIVCHHYQIERVRAWAEEAGIAADRLRIVLSVFDYSIWAQDAYVALSAEGYGAILCEGVLFPRYDDMSIADDVAAQTTTSNLQSMLYFQGGNVLGTPTVNLVGTDYVWQNTGRAKLENEEAVLAQFSELFGGETISLGRRTAIPAADRRRGLNGLFQPIFHIDMYVTPTGVIGDSGKEVVLVGRPALARELLRQYAGPYDFDHYFAETEEQLSNWFEVLSLPLLPEYGDLGGGAAPAFYHLTWNNAVLENFEDDNCNACRVVYMPTYAEDADRYGVDRAERELLDDAAAQIWESLGFQVRPMDGLEDLAYSAGSVHCITKALGRSNYVAPPVV